MTKRERLVLRGAIRDLNGDRYDDAMEALCRLAGIETPLADIAKTARQVPVHELANRGQQPFGYPVVAGRRTCGKCGESVPSEVFNEHLRYCDGSIVVDEPGEERA